MTNKLFGFQIGFLLAILPIIMGNSYGAIENGNNLLNCIEGINHSLTANLTKSKLEVSFDTSDCGGHISDMSAGVRPEPVPVGSDYCVYGSQGTCSGNIRNHKCGGERRIDKCSSTCSINVLSVDLLKIIIMESILIIIISKFLMPSGIVILITCDTECQRELENVSGLCFGTKLMAGQLEIDMDALIVIPLQVLTLFVFRLRYIGI